MATQSAVIVGVGKGLSASLARRLAREGYRLVLVARNTDKLADLVAETGAIAHQAETSDPAAIERLFAMVDREMGTPDLVVFNGGARYRGAIETLDPEEMLRAHMVTGHAAFLVAQAAAKRMLAAGRGSIFFTGATASVKSLPKSVPFAMGKFAIRALAQGLARELAPRNIHVAHFVIDGGIASSWAKGDDDGPPDKWLDPDAIADTYLMIHRQHRSAWTWEIELRPWVESF